MYLLYSLRCYPPGHGDTEEHAQRGAQGPETGSQGCAGWGCRPGTSTTGSEAPEPGVPRGNAAGAFIEVRECSPDEAVNAGVFMAWSLEGGHQSRDVWGRAHLQG